MDNVGDYVDVLIQAPLAVIQVVFIYLTIKMITGFMNSVTKQLNEMQGKMSDLLSEAIKIIKQHEREKKQ